MVVGSQAGEMSVQLLKQYPADQGIIVYLC